MHFLPSALGTLGAELELQIIDARTFDLCNGIIPILEHIQQSPFVRPELTQDSIEIGTRVCQSAADLEEHLIEVAGLLHRDIEALGMTLCGAGTHAFCQRLATITPRPRYLDLAKRNGFLARRQQVFATHVHVGVRSGPEAIAIMRELRMYLPVFLALAANSPFWRGHETDCASYRHRILAATRSYGVPPAFDSWQQFGDFCETTGRAGLFASVKDIHWDIRPQPRLGTVELRVMDAQSSLRHVAELAAFTRALVVYLSREARGPDLPQPLPWWISKENHFQASRFGLDALYVQDAMGTVSPLRELCYRVLDTVIDVGTELGDAAYLAALRTDLLQRPGYQSQRESVAGSPGNFRSVVETLVEEFVASLAGSPL